MSGFVHLHVHSEYSLLDGAARIGDVIAKAKALGQTAIAITDHGAMYGVVDFYNAAKKAGIKPILGYEAYVAADLHEKTSKNREYAHLLLLAKTQQGYQNLMQLCSIGFLEGYYYKPRIDYDTLEKYSEGLICSSACIGGDLPQMLLQGRMEEARALALRLKGMFGRDFYIEIQDHGLPEERRVNPLLIALARELDIPLIATNDSHYVEKEDARAQDILMCLQMGRTLADGGGLFQTDEFYIKSEQEMRALFSYVPEALDNTVKIAEQCNVEIEQGVFHMPKYEVPGGMDDKAYLEKLVREGMARRYGENAAAHEERMTYELGVINSMGFTDYFLIVWDYVNFAREQHIMVGPGRGSAAGSIVAYALGITDIDPIEYNLLFERFLNPARVSMPDIDIDFCIERRQEVIEYVAEKYGRDHVAQIITFGTLGAKQVVRDVARVMGISVQEADRVAKMIPFAVKMTIQQALEESPRLREEYENDERIHAWLDLAMKIEGMPRQSSTHAAAVVISASPVTDYSPLVLNKKDESITTQYNMHNIEALGLLKMDFLGLRNLTVIRDAELQIQQREPQFRMDRIPDDDPETFQMLAEGKTQGVFQLESAGMTGVCVNMRASSIEDITAIVALYRPGPMDSIPTFIANKLDRRKVRYKTPMLEPILKVTYGCIVYQEQVIEIFRSLGGYSMGQADNIRRAISKKKMKVIEAERKVFVYGDPAQNIAGCIGHGVPEAVAQSIYDEIVDFANYAFNKAHAVCYAVVSYQTAYLKCHYPRQYMAALMTSVLDSAEKISGYIAECKEMNIPVLPPDINHSEDHFTVEGEGIRFGLGAVKNIGRGLIRTMMQKRIEGGPFTSLESFIERMGEGELNKRAVENFIKCGAMDCFGCHRSELLAVYNTMMDSIASSRKKNLEGQIGLFSMMDDQDANAVRITIPSLPELDRAEMMAMEKETTGIYLSGHPMDDYRKYLKGTHVIPIGELMAEDSSYEDEQVVSVAGIVQTVKMKTTRNQSMMAYLTVEDDTASIEMLAFSNVLSQYGGYLHENSPVVITGRLSLRDDKEPQIVVNRARPISDYAQERTESQPPQLPQQPKNGTLYLRLPAEDDVLYPKIRAILNMFPGNNPVVLFFADTKHRRGTWAALMENMLGELERVLGKGNVVIK